MPLQYDDVPGSWGTQSEGWPAIHDPDGAARRLVIKGGLVPYGSYVTVGDMLRLERQEYVAKVAAALTAAQQQGQAVACRWPSCECPNGTAGCPKRTAPPTSAPVGVNDALRAIAEVLPPKPIGANAFGYQMSPLALATLHDRFAALTAALAQQPAAVDGAVIQAARALFDPANTWPMAAKLEQLRRALATQHQEPTT